ARVYLGITVGEDDIEYILNAFTGGALYAYRDSIRDGYVSLGAGIRVGVCGQARYDGDELVGISCVSALLIRFPCFDCRFTDRLVEAFSSAERGLMIFAPPCSGKTTALRSLLLRLSSMGTGRISLIDERCEVVTDDFKFSDIDVFCGYRRADGIRTALRVMSPDIIAVDELCVARESCEIIESLLSGVKFIATAHARDFSDLSKRPAVAPFLDLGIFDVFSKIFHTDTGLECEIFSL
ncbi:MAG: Flp pilus assembly complex ATPase component TadA, partial [Clostridia bacterium]|nr:Flp pilus assembly complex ATPase component TadA [Clostridia bacterium]